MIETKMSRVVMPSADNGTGVLFGGSLHVKTTVLIDGQDGEAAEAIFVYVALDKEGRPRKVNKKI